MHCPICVRVPENSSELFNNTNINIQNLERDIDLNYIIKDKPEMLDAVGAYWEDIYSDKEVLDRNENIINVKQLLKHFLEETNKEAIVGRARL